VNAPTLGHDLSEAPTGNMPDLPRLCVMLSGGGRTLTNIIERTQRHPESPGALAARVVSVITSGPCPGVERARAAGIKRIETIEGVIPAPLLGSLLDRDRVDLLVLAGYLKIVRIPPGYEGRVVNIHPALLPKFGGKGMHGLRVHEAVIKAGERESGCTVHACDATYDTGAIILQKRCAVLHNDTPQTLADRVFALECEAFPEAIAMVLSKVGRRA